MNHKAVVRFAFALGVAMGVFVPNAVAQQQQAPIVGDMVVRQEWNSGFFAKPDPVPAKRTRVQIRPRFEVESRSFRMGLGADINYSSDDNLKPEGLALPLALVRDNYDSRSVRLDVAYLGLNLSPTLKIDAGRMIMPFRTTDMIWDKDLRVQGLSGSWSFGQAKTGEPIVRVSGVYSRGSHVFVDSVEADGASTGDGVTVTGGSVDVGFGADTRVDLSASYLAFDKLENLERMIRRQNTRVNGALTREYGVVDAVLRLRVSEPFPMQLALNGATNRKADDQKNGVWVTFVAGSLVQQRIRAEYTYAKVDKDVTVAAYAGDDFLWGTGWRGHRAEIGFAQSAKSSFHIIGQMQQFKDSPTLAERTVWVKRLRLEARRSF